jgi:predicted CXXCH cytochrome family protein
VTPLALLAAALIVPGPGAQTTRAAVRVVVEAKGAVELRPGGVCGGSQAGFVHCKVELAPGENSLELLRGGAAEPLLLLRQVTTSPQVPGVDQAGFGVQTVHRAEVEKLCARCHAMDDWKGRAAGDSMLGTECARCHADVVSRPRQHGPVAQGACLMCHDAASSPQRYAVKWPIQETCFRCHTDIQEQMLRKAYRHGPAAAGRCTTCHDPHGSDNDFWLKKPVFDLCTNCHTEKADGRHVLVGFVYGDSHPLRGREHPLKPAPFYCSSCHNPHAAQSRFLWQFDVTEREQLCETCHRK